MKAFKASAIIVDKWNCVNVKRGEKKGKLIMKVTHNGKSIEKLFFLFAPSAASSHLANRAEIKGKSVRNLTEN